MADAVEDMQKGGSVAKDLFSGAVGGVAQVLIGMSFFLICSFFSLLKSLSRIVG